MDGEKTARHRRRPGLVRADLGLGRNVGLLFWAYLVWGAGFALYLPIWTLFVGRLGASPGQIGLVVGVSAIARTVLAIPAGHVVDRLAPKPVMVETMALPVLGMLILLGSAEWWHALVAALGENAPAGERPGRRDR